MCQAVSLKIQSISSPGSTLIHFVPLNIVCYFKVKDDRKWPASFPVVSSKALVQISVRLRDNRKG